MNQNEKQAYERFVALVGGNAQSVTPHILQLEAEMSTTETSLTFILEQDNGGGLNSRTETRLDKNDLFQVAAIGVYLSAPVDKDDVTYRLCSYPNALIFPNTKDQMEVIYKGSLKVSVDNIVAINKWSVMRHYFVPQVQDTTGSSTIRDNFNAQRDGIASIFPGMILAGNRKTDISLNLPRNITALESGKRPRVIVRLYGFLATNAVKYQS